MFLGATPTLYVPNKNVDKSSDTATSSTSSPLSMLIALRLGMLPLVIVIQKNLEQKYIEHIILRFCTYVFMPFCLFLLNV